MGKWRSSAFHVSLLTPIQREFTHHPSLMTLDRYRRWTQIVLILCLSISTSQTVAGPTRSELQTDVSNSRRNAIVNAVELASPAVVNISTTRIQEVNVRPSFNDLWTPFFDFGFRYPQRRELHGLGSGVVFDRRGYVLTNQHVIGGADVTKVILSDGREYEAKIVGEDFLTDLAVLEVDAQNLTEIGLGRADDLMIGEWAIAIGHPFAAAVGDPSPTVTIGVVSATDRALKTEDRLYRRLIQTDASINPGNSGGALVNLYGQLIGINTAIYSTSGGSQGIGFAIPVNTAIKVVDHLIEYGAVVPPYLGVETQDLTPKLAEALSLEGRFGVLVAGVEAESPAGEAGLQRRDVIEKIDQEPVTSSETFLAITRLLHENQTVNFQVFRGGNRKNLSLKIRELQWKYTTRVWGITIEQPDRKLTQNHNRRGVVVTKVNRRSVLAERGLQRGDLIYRINNSNINSLEDFKRITSQLRRNQLINLYFERKGKEWKIPNLMMR